MMADRRSFLMQGEVLECDRRERLWRQAMQQAIEAVLVARFPDAPLRLLPALRQLNDPLQLATLHGALLNAPDGAAVEALIAAAVADRSA
jgi:hypothetical protein